MQSNNLAEEHFKGSGVSLAKEEPAGIAATATEVATVESESGEVES